MHELLVSRGFVRRADAPSLAEVKEKEAVAEAAAAEAAAVRKKERAEAAAKRKLDKETNRNKYDKKLADKDRTKVPSCCIFFVLLCILLAIRNANPTSFVCFEACMLDK